MGNNLTPQQREFLHNMMTGSHNTSGLRRREKLGCGCQGAAILVTAAFALYILLGLKSNEADNKKENINNNPRNLTSQALIEYLGGMQTIVEINVIRDSKGNVQGCDLNLLEHASNLNLSDKAKIVYVDRKSISINQNIAPSQNVKRLNPNDGFSILYEEVNIITDPKKQTKTTFSVAGSCSPSPHLRFNGQVDPSNHKIVTLP